MASSVVYMNCVYFTDHDALQSLIISLSHAREFYAFLLYQNFRGKSYYYDSWKLTTTTTIIIIIIIIISSSSSSIT